MKCPYCNDMQYQNNINEQYECQICFTKYMLIGKNKKIISLTKESQYILMKSFLYVPLTMGTPFLAALIIILLINNSYMQQMILFLGIALLVHPIYHILRPSNDGENLFFIYWKLLRLKYNELNKNDYYYLYGSIILLIIGGIIIMITRIIKWVA